MVYLLENNLILRVNYLILLKVILRFETINILISKQNKLLKWELFRKFKNLDIFYVNYFISTIYFDMRKIHILRVEIKIIHLRKFHYESR